VLDFLCSISLLSATPNYDRIPHTNTSSYSLHCGKVMQTVLSHHSYPPLKRPIFLFKMEVSVLAKGDSQAAQHRTFRNRQSYRNSWFGQLLISDLGILFNLWEKTGYYYLSK
jgi:hypothetical protein